MTSGLVDAAGTAHRPAGPDARIVCLVPSITELLCDLGLAPRLVGRTGFCVRPRELVRAIPKVGGTKDVKIDRVRDLAPTHLVVNVEENRRETVEELSASVPSIVVTDVRDPLENPPLYRLLGGIFGREAEAKRLCERFDRAYAELAATSFPPVDVLYLIWHDPWMTVGRDTYISRTLALVGWRTAPAVAEPRYPAVEPADVGPVDRVLLSSEPYRFRERHVAEAESAFGAPASPIDGQMTSWYGSRAIVALGELARYARG